MGGFRMGGFRTRPYENRIGNRLVGAGSKPALKLNIQAKEYTFLSICFCHYLSYLLRKIARIELSHSDGSKGEE